MIICSLMLLDHIHMFSSMPPLPTASWTELQPPEGFADAAKSRVLHCCRRSASGARRTGSGPPVIVSQRNAVTAPAYMCFSLSTPVWVLYEPDHPCHKGATLRILRHTRPRRNTKEDNSTASMQTLQAGPNKHISHFRWYSFSNSPLNVKLAQWHG